MDKYKTEKLIETLIDKITTLESVNEYYLAENDRLHSKIAALKTKIEILATSEVN